MEDDGKALALRMQVQRLFENPEEMLEAEIVSDEEFSARPNTKEFEAAQQAYQMENDVEGYCKANNLICVYPGDRHLLLDLDTAAQLKQAHEMLEKFGKELGISKIGETKSKNGKDHWYLSMTDSGKSKFEKLLLQSCFGSDPKREIMGLIRLYKNVPFWSQLFETPEEVVRNIGWMKREGLLSA